MTRITITTQGQQGPIGSGLTIDLNGDYIVLTGANNAGKSSLLQCMFKRCVSGGIPCNSDNVCLLLPDRIYVDMNIQVGSRTLTMYNGELANSIHSQNRSYQSPNNNPLSSELPKLLLNHTDLQDQLNRLHTLLEYFGLPKSRVRGAQEVMFQDISVMFQGSGLRSIFGVLAALTDDAIKVLLIDEPELGLEARYQRLLRDLLVEFSKTKQIVVATQSHLFLNRETCQSNYRVTRENGQVSLAPVLSQEDLFDITFHMLGSSPEDLFFPQNFLIVEGATDQMIANKVMELKGVDKTRIKVVSASGIDNVDNVMNAVYNSVLPFVASNSPYKGRIVALVDMPNKQGQQTYKKLKDVLADRLFTLPEPSLEEFYPEELYKRCHRVKGDDLKDIGRAKDHLAKKQLKTDIATAVTAKLTESDLPMLQIFVDAIEKAR